MTEVNVNEDVRKLVEEIIVENNWETIGEVKYHPGTETGDGYASKHVAIEIPLKTGPFRLFAKYSLFLATSENLSLNKIYGNETYFYEKVCPAFKKFSQDKGVKEAFNNVPKCYGTSPKFTIVLENLRDEGFRLYERTICMDESHIVLIMKAFAKFHAISFAMKDQEKEVYKRLVNEWDGDFMGAQKKDAPAQRMFRNMIAEGVQKFDREEDRPLREKCNVDDLFDCIRETVKKHDKYSVFTQGDCWCNNMMFLYKGETNTNPIDVKLIDWQMFRPTSTVYDLSYFFFSTASAEALKNHHYYLNIYYQELCDQIKKFGSDPEFLYPKSAFDSEWKRYCKYGFAFSFVIFKFVLADKEEAPKLENYDFDGASDDTEDIQLFATFSNEDEYVRRLRILAGFMMDNDYI